jgi:hypothetical protein
MPNMEKAALRTRPLPKCDLAGASIDPEDTHSLIHLQACHLTRRCAISLAMAVTIAPLLHGEARQ